MKKFIGLMLISAFAASCVNLDGHLNVQQTMNVKKKGGFLNMKTKTVELEPGIYKAELKVKDRDSLTLKLRLEKENDDEIKIPLKSDKDFNLPDNGEVRISGSEVKQPFDVVGTIKTSITRSDSRRAVEECSLSVIERHCEKVCRPAGRNGDRVVCNVVCRDVSVTIPGVREYEYHTRFTHRDLEVDLKDVNTQAQLATLRTTGTESERVTDYYGPCRR